MIVSKSLTFDVRGGPKGDYGDFATDSSDSALRLTACPKLVNTSTAHVEQHATDGESDSALRCPLNLAGHEAARQYV